ncbi:hypothetical protein AD998_10100 [bacterium 336/3]|nr:hypothetical protein AD998_10100 [bacterium 336/3]
MATISANAKNIGKIYVFESDANGFNTKTVFYDDGKEVVAFDAQFTEATAQQAIEFLRTKTQNPIKYLVVTHPNPDKFNGIPAFKKVGATVIMSKFSANNIEMVHNYKKYYFVEMAKMFTNETYPTLPTADLTFDETYDIKLANGGKVKLTELKKSAIATNQTIAFIETVNALVIGDLVHHNVHAWLEGPINNNTTTYNNANWISVLKILESKYPANVMVYGGRGESGKLSVVVTQQISYLEKAEKLTKEYLISIGNDKSKVDYTQLQKVFEKAFPNYSLGYMIAYGAYGMVGSMK